MNLDNHASESYLGLVWNVYNSVMLSVALIALVDVPTANPDQWFRRRQLVQIISNVTSHWGMMTMLSEAGAEIELRTVDLAQQVKLHLAEAEIKLQGQVTATQWTGSCWRVRVKFEAVSTWEHRRLIELLYCRPGQWQHHQTPGEWRSLWLLLKVLSRPLVRLISLTAAQRSLTNRVKGKGKGVKQKEYD